MSRYSPGKRRWSWFATKLRRVNPYLGSFFVSAIFLGLALCLPERTGRWSASAILLMAVLASASLWGLRQGLIASVFAALAYDFFFIPPLYRLEIEDWQNAVSLLILGLAAAAVSAVAEILNRRTRAARLDEILAKQLYSLGQHLRDADDIASVAQKVAASVGAAVGAKAILLLPKEDVLTVAAAHPAGASLNRAEQEAVKYSCAYNLRRIGDATPASGLTCTLLAVDKAVEKDAILIVGETARRFSQLPQRMRIVDMLAGAASSAFTRIALAKHAKDAQVAAEAEKLRSALLTSISHDLKTPLAIVLGSATSLLDLGGKLQESAAQELLHSIVEEGERLNQFISNLLDMSRVESQAVSPRQQLAELNDIVGSALERARHALSRHRLVLQVPDDIPSMELDPVLLEKALFNILENAAHYTPPGTQITLTVSREGEWVIIQILDEGPGIPAQELRHLFDKFYRGGSGTWRPTGTGLGLAIARGFVEAMGGWAAASNRSDRSGAVFTIRLPVKPARAVLIQVPPPLLARAS